MPVMLPTRVPNAAEVAALDPQQTAELLQGYAQAVDTLKHQVEWFKRQLFGHKSERFAPTPDPQQMHLGEVLAQVPQHSEPGSQVPAHTRRRPRSDFADDSTSAPFFDEARVPVQTIEVPNVETQGLASEQYEVIGEKLSYRLAQRTGSYVVLKYVRPVIKRRDTQTLHCPSAPVGVIEGSRADVSFVAGVLVDKFAWHLPLYRQHQRLADAGFRLSRPWLTQIAQQGAQLLEPIYDAQFDSIRASRVKAMDETPIKAGRAGPGKMKGGYFWPVYGELDEVCFPYFESRRHEHVQQALGLSNAPDAVLLSDGYEAYASYAKKTGVTHAQCWIHARRTFFEAQDAEPQAAAEALRQIGALYEIEEDIRGAKLSGENKRLHRLTHSKPAVEQFFEWIDRQFERQGLLPSNPLTKALAYVRERRAGLQVFLGDADVPMDTNHLERALRAIPMGRRNWLFCWTEVGAKHAGIVQSLIVTCRLHGIDPVHVSRGRAAARGRAPGGAGGRTHAAPVEAALRRQAPALGLAQDSPVGKNAGGLPLTLQTEAPIDPSSLTRWRQRIGEEGVETLLMLTIDAARRAGMINKASVDKVIVDTTVMPKAIAHPTDSRLLEKSRQHLVRLADEQELKLRQNYNREAPRMAAQIGRYAHAKQYKRMRKTVKALRTRVGRIHREVSRQVDTLPAQVQPKVQDLLHRVGRLLTQKTKDKNKLYALHAPEVECISKGKARTPYEFGVKVTVATTLKEGLVVGMRSMPGNPWDGHTLAETIEQVSILADQKPTTAIVDKGYQGVEVDGVRILRSGQRWGITRTLKAMIKRRSAIEPTIGHMKMDGRLARNPLKGALGDAVHAVMCGAGHNIRLLLRKLRLLCVDWRQAVWAVLNSLALRNHATMALVA